MSLERRSLLGLSLPSFRYLLSLAVSVPMEREEGKDGETSRNLAVTSFSFSLLFPFPFPWARTLSVILEDEAHGREKG